MGRDKYILIISTVALIIIGIGYATGMPKPLADAFLFNPYNIIFLSDECKVTETSEGVTADIEFKRDQLGNITDNTSVHMVVQNAHAGAKAEFLLTARNISEVPLSVDEYKLILDENINSIAGLMYFSGKVKIYDAKNEYYNLIGSFSRVGLWELDDTLTSLLEYRKIDLSERFVLELTIDFDNDSRKYEGKTGISYELIPVFIQYFPDKETKDQMPAVE